ncbi:MAG: histidine kinase, partial [Negativicutes bacterium]|nr:histidine kinase [Negativicutes bacterium]
MCIRDSGSALPMSIQLSRYAPSWGIAGKLRAGSGVGEAIWVADQGDVIVGQTVGQGSNVEGFLFFVLPNARLMEIINVPGVQFIVRDRLDNVIVCSDRAFADEFRKVRPVLANAAGYTDVDGNRFYVTERTVENGGLVVTAIFSLGNIVSQMTSVLLVLLAILAVMAVTIAVRVRRQVDQKTQAIDQLIEAFAAAKQGDFDQRLELAGSSDFQVVEEAYNLMLDSIRKLMRQNYEEARANAISEIKQLESQFNPHFLFNTLENIRFMIRLDPDRACQMIVWLAGMLRYSIDFTGNEVTLAEDIAHTENYLKIQKLRYGDRLDYRISLPGELEDALIPKLICQPIIENAVKHGAGTEKPLLVEINIGPGRDHLKIEIVNNGLPIPPGDLRQLKQMLASPVSPGRHSGLYNLQRRIRLMYGEPFGLDIFSIDDTGGVRVEIILPLRSGAGSADSCTKY